jgi:hypothetical protein
MKNSMTESCAQLANEVKAMRFLRLRALPQGREKSNRVGCIGAVPLKLSDALVLLSDVIFD